jgi:hypothetical protein
MFALEQQHFAHAEAGQVITRIGGQRFGQLRQRFIEKSYMTQN